MADPRRLEMGEPRRDEAFARDASSARRVAAHAQPGFDERAEQPGPGRALVIRVIALGRPAAVMAGVPRLEARERAQTERRQELALDALDDFARDAAVD